MIPALFRTLVLLGNIAAFFVSFLLVCSGIGVILPEVVVPVISAKLAWLEEHEDEYNVIFLGSSRTHHQVLPDTFDSEMAKGGQEVRSFNLGAGGMRPPEDTYVLEKLLSRRTKPLRLVVVECNPVRLRLTPQLRDTVRAVYWHDNTRMGAIICSVFFNDPKKRTWEKRFQKTAEVWPDFSEHIGYWVSRNSNLGRGHELLTEWAGVGQSPMLPAADNAGRLDGFQPYPQAEPMNAEKYAAQIAKYEKELSEMRANPAKWNADDMVSLEELRTKRRFIERTGARMVLVIPPYIGGHLFRPNLAAGVLPVLDFSSYEKYPELFTYEHRADVGNTNMRGSQIYTRLLARELLVSLQKEEH